MPAPENAADVLPVTWQIVVGAVTLAGTLGAALLKAMKSFKATDPQPEQQHVVLERAELADMAPIRELVREFKPALEKLTRIEGMSLYMQEQVKDICEKLTKMEESSRWAERLRAERERWEAEQERRHEWRERDRDR